MGNLQGNNTNLCPEWEDPKHDTSIRAMGTMRKMTAIGQVADFVSSLQTNII